MNGITIAVLEVTKECINGTTDLRVVASCGDDVAGLRVYTTPKWLKKYEKKLTKVLKTLQKE